MENNKHWTPPAQLHGQTNEVATRRANQLANVLQLTPEAVQALRPITAYTNGLTIHTALGVDRAKTKLWLLAQLTRLWHSIGLPPEKTWRDQTALEMAVDDITALFPSMKMEEIAVVFQRIRTGVTKLYGRLDTAVLCDAIREYEMEYTVTFRENHHNARREEPAQTQRHGCAQSLTHAIANLDLPRRRKVYAELNGPRNLSPDEVQMLTEAQAAARERMSKTTE